MSYTHNTPYAVAKRLITWAPKKFSTILEPSAGNLSLIKPLYNQIRNNNAKCILIDNEKSIIKSCINELKDKDINHLVIQDDYLKVDLKESCGINSFDFIIMNPPFDARTNIRNNIHKITNIGYNPIESAFIIKSIEHLNENGRLLAVLPKSIITGQNTSWLRKYLNSTGNILHVHELPHNTFKNIEVSLYLLVYKKCFNSKHVYLYNHHLVSPHKIKICKNDINYDRLDYGYYRSVINYNIIKSNKRFKFNKLSEICKIYRGKKKSPIIDNNIIHTTNIFNKKYLPFKNSDRISIVVPRVMRNCNKYFRIIQSYEISKYSDCILKIVPNKKKDIYKILFSLRIILTNDEMSPLICSGVCAQYIKQKSLQDIEIPINLSIIYNYYYKKYLKKINENDISGMIKIEENIFKKIIDNYNE